MDRDPVCKRKMNRNKAYVTIQYKGEDYYLCCPLCQAEFEKNPEKYLNGNT
jgi:YHS domain-containing protein